MNIPRDNMPRDPNDIDPPRPDPLAQEPLTGGETRSTAERNEMRRAESSWGLLPGIIGLVIVVALGLLIFSGGRNETTTPATRSTDVQTPATTPKTTPSQPQ
jgi:hypothetical protein